MECVVKHYGWLFLPHHSSRVLSVAVCGHHAELSSAGDTEDGSLVMDLWGALDGRLAFAHLPTVMHTQGIAS